MKNISIFASGSGTNAENIIKYFSNTTTARVNLVLSNKPEAMVLKRAAALDIKTFVFDRHDFYETERVLEKLVGCNTDFIVLAGFLWLVPVNILEHFSGRIVNIHPALLPSYGGKGMYGDAVHKAVIDSGDTESGITIHYVDNNYDKGKIIFQAHCRIEKEDTPQTLASKVHQLEYLHFPRVIEELVLNLPS